MVVFPTNAGAGGFLNPAAVVDEIGIIEKEMVIADFGCGNGYFSLPLSKKVGDNGKIFALDVLTDALEAVSSRMKIEGVSNIETKRRNLEKEGGSGLLDGSCDVVLMANLLFQTEDDEVVAREAKRVLKVGGRVIFIDWKLGVSLGPQGKRVSPEKIKELLGKEGFSFEKDFSTDSYHFGMIFRK